MGRRYLRDIASIVYENYRATPHEIKKENIFLAIDANNLENVENISKNFAVFEKTYLGLNPINYAAQHQEWACLDVLLDQIDEVRAKSLNLSFALLDCIKSRRILTLEKLIKLGAINDNTWKNNPDQISPIELSITMNLSQAIPMLVNNHADITVKDKNGLNLLKKAAMLGHWECAEELLKFDYFKNNSKLLGNILLISIANQRTDFSKKLIQNGADLDTYNSNGLTPIHIAAQNNDTLLTSALLEAKADPNQMTASSNTGRLQTALELAIIRKHHNIISLLDPDRYNPSKIALNEFSEPISFYETRNKLKLMLEENAHLKTKEISKHISDDCKASLFDLAEITLYLSNEEKFKNIPFVKDTFEFFKNKIIKSHPYIAKALLAILRNTFEATDSLTPLAKQHIRDTLKIHKPPQNIIKEGLIDSSDLIAMEETACATLAEELYKPNLSNVNNALAKKVSEIAASEYLQKMAHLRKYEEFDKTTLNNLFGVFKQEWFWQKSALRKCLSAFIKKHKKLNCLSHSDPSEQLYAPSAPFESIGKNITLLPSMMNMHQQFPPSQSLSTQKEPTIDPESLAHSTTNQTSIPIPSADEDGLVTYIPASAGEDGLVTYTRTRR